MALEERGSGHVRYRAIVRVTATSMPSGGSTAGAMAKHTPGARCEGAPPLVVCDELLGVGVFDAPVEAQVLVERRRRHHNTMGPHG